MRLKQPTGRHLDGRVIQVATHAALVPRDQYRCITSHWQDRDPAFPRGAPGRQPRAVVPVAARHRHVRSIAWSQPRAPFGKTTGFASIAARTPLYENGDGLRTGASIEINGGAARELWNHRVTGLARLGWLHRQQDVFRGTPVLVGGGNWLYVTPGVGLLIGKGVNVQAEVKVPLYRSLANKQLDSRAVFQFGVSRSF